MARIKHVAIRTPDPEKTAAFYKEVFGLREVGLASSGYYPSAVAASLLSASLIGFDARQAPGTHNANVDQVVAV